MPGLAFRQTFRRAQGRECIERLKAPSKAEGLRVDPERRVRPRPEGPGGGAAERVKTMSQSNESSYIVSHPPS